MRTLLPAVLLILVALSCNQQEKIPEDYTALLDKTRKVVELSRSDLKAAHALARENLAEAKSKGYDYLVAKNYTYIGWIFDEQNLLKKSYIAYNDALNYWEKSDSVSNSNVYTCYNNLGIICRKFEEYDQAIKYYEKTLDYVIYKDEDDHADVLYNLAVAYKLKGDRESTAKAEEYFTKSLEIAEKADYNVGIASVYFQIGKMYKDIEDYDISEMSFKNCLKFSLANDLDEYAEVAYHGLGQIEKLKGNYEKAIPHFENALAINYDPNLIFEVKKDLGESYLSMDRAKEAIEVWQSALTENFDPNDPDVLDVYRNLAMAYQMDQKLDKALAFSNKYSSNLQNKLQSTDYIKGGYEQILFKEVISQYDEFQTQQTFKEKLRNTYGPAAAASVLFLSVLFIVLYYQRKTRKKLTAEKIKSFQVD